MEVVLNNVYYYRKLRGLTQSQLADLVGYSKNTISALETTLYSPGVDLVYRLCYALDVNFNELFVLCTLSDDRHHGDRLLSKL